MILMVNLRIRIKICGKLEGKVQNLWVEETAISRVFRSGARVSSVDRGRSYAAPASKWVRALRPASTIGFFIFYYIINM